MFTELLASESRIFNTQQTQNICITFVQRRPNIVQMLYDCFVFTGYGHLAYDFMPITTSMKHTNNSEGQELAH